MEKLKVNHFKMILYINIALIVIGVILYISITGYPFWDPFWLTLILIAYVLFSLLFSILCVKTFKMEYDNKKFVFTRFAKEEIYEFKDILYIDEPYTQKHKALCFYMKSGKLKFISFDREKKILKVFLDNCKNTVSREEFQRIFPTIRL